MDLSEGVKMGKTRCRLITEVMNLFITGPLMSIKFPSNKESEVTGDCFAGGSGHPDPDQMHLSGFIISSDMIHHYWLEFFEARGSCLIMWHTALYVNLITEMSSSTKRQSLRRTEATTVLSFKNSHKQMVSCKHQIIHFGSNGPTANFNE